MLVAGHFKVDRHPLEIPDVGDGCASFVPSSAKISFESSYPAHR